MQHEYWTVKEIAAKYRITERTVYRLVKQRRLSAYRVGGQYRFDPKQVKRQFYIDSLHDLAEEGDSCT